MVRAAEADEGQQEPPSEPSQQTQPQPQSRQQPPPPHKIYRGVAGSPTSYPIVPPYRPGMEEEDEDDYEWIDVGKQFQVPNPERGPLEQQISTSFVQGMMADKVNLDETNYWFTEPPGEQLSFVRFYSSTLAVHALQREVLSHISFCEHACCKPGLTRVYVTERCDAHSRLACMHTVEMSGRARAMQCTLSRATSQTVNS